MEKKSSGTMIKLHTIIVGELMSIRGEIAFLSTFMAELDNIEEAKKEKLVKIAERNVKRFEFMEELFESFKNAQTDQKQD